MQEVGGDLHQELWVPAEELEVFNDHIRGVIEIAKVFKGDKFREPESRVVAEALQKHQ
ncbi:hypothetical protein HNQ91_001207 [Filimonas zeae]|uniref:Uncharacterized protein n=1 Tax=Filimonas zeae TaxID=1737353 RepID=A0A917MT57_9BACT|nr:hypothetical protein [Filimonas zeae]MDR6338185.1 hypothetical protein [Filimonas zeae]GGH62136.1 hypothetical protein GCM10011379_11810 [Filimonas zeae]